MRSKALVSMLFGVMLIAGPLQAVDYSFYIVDCDSNENVEGDIVVWQKLETAATWEYVTEFHWAPNQTPFSGGSNYFYAFRAIDGGDYPYSPYAYPERVSGTVVLYCTLSEPPDDPSE